jgi:hypothetical protein
MNRIVVKTKISREGVLHLDLLKGLEDREVYVTIDELSSAPKLKGQEWKDWVRSMAGSWKGDLVRPDQGHFEEREPLS